MKATILRVLSILILFLAVALPASTRAAASPAAPAPEAQDATPVPPQTLQAAADAALKLGEPGTAITFNVAVSAARAGNIAVQTSNSAGWTVSATPNPLSLEDPALAGSVQITVAIPPNVSGGAETNLVVTFSDTQAPGASASVSLTARAVTTQASRPVVVIKSHSMDKDTVRPGESFRLFLTARNDGAQTAQNLVFTFAGEALLPQDNGGVAVVGALGAGQEREFSQRFLVSTSLWGSTTASLPVKLSYNGPTGEAYTEDFNVIVEILGFIPGSAVTATPTPTGTALPRPQLVVKGYQTDVSPLQPGLVFKLDLEAQNLGSGDARNVTMVLGGGTNTIDPSVTPQPGGVPGGISGSGGDLSTFAPIGSSNVVFLGDVVTGAMIKATQEFIVNVSANPGAYPLKLSFIYTDSRGNRLVDDQVITLLVYQLPLLEINFYRDPGPIFAMQPNQIPVQVVNLGRKSAVLGNMTVTAENAQLMNNTMLVGALDMGGYFPLDVMLIPNEPGPLELKVTVQYTDDFNQPRTVEQTLTLDVQESAPMPEGPVIGPDGQPIEPGMEGPVDMPVEETFWQKALRFLKGLVGLDSAAPQPVQPGMPGEMPPEGEPVPAPPLG